MPVLSVEPVPIEALLAPAPVFPESELVSAMVVVDEAFWPANGAVRAQAGLAFGAVCAKADAESARPIATVADATVAEKMKRDI